MKQCPRCSNVNDTNHSMCSSCKREYNKQYRSKHKEYYKAYKKLPRYRDQQRLYHEQNRDKILIRHKLHKVANSNQYAGYERKRRATKRSLPSEKYTEHDVIMIYGSLCFLCGDQIDLNAARRVGRPGWEDGLHVDHVIPISKGGSDVLGNVRPTHGKCNLLKGDRANEE